MTTDLHQGLISSSQAQGAAGAAKPIFPIPKLDRPGDLEKGPDLPAALAAMVADNAFAGSIGEVLVAPDGVAVGAGDLTDPFALAAVPEKIGAGTFRLAPGDPLSARFSGTCLALGWLLGRYRFDRYRPAPASEAVLLVDDTIDVPAVQSEAQAVFLVRDLVNTPAADMGPAALERICTSLAQTHGARLAVTRGEALLQENFPMIHAVGRAAAEEPRLLDLSWSPKEAADSARLPLVCLVGKGVTFDSGGLNIKGATGMALMKKDMGGAAHALGLAQMIMQAGLPIRLRVLLPTVENAIAGTAFRPSDILQSREGLTVEIGNTDAEGRLILADALTFGAEDSPDLMISLATLTGAARVALGPEVVPFYTDDEAISSRFQALAAAHFDPVWPMPLWSRYQTMLASPIADLGNIGSGSFAGSILAALFLQRFLPAGQRWMHFDLYAWKPAPEPGRPKGGEAQAIRALFALLRDRYDTGSTNR